MCIFLQKINKFKKEKKRKKQRNEVNMFKGRISVYSTYPKQFQKKGLFAYFF